MNSQIHRWTARYIDEGLGGSWAQELLFPWSWDASPSQYMEALRIPYYWDIMKASSGRHNELLAPLPSPFPLLRMRGWSWEFQASNHDFFLVTTRSPPRVTSLAQKMLLVLLSLRNFQGFQEPCVRNWGQRPNIITRDVSSTLIP